MIVTFPAEQTPRESSSVGDGSMHIAFEIRWMTNLVVGPRPPVTILRIAWEDKRQHVQQFLREYYRRHNTLPRGSHDLGATRSHHLSIGDIDFDALGRRLEFELEKRQQLQAVLPRLQRMFSTPVVRLTAPLLASLATWGQVLRRGLAARGGLRY